MNVILGHGQGPAFGLGHERSAAATSRERVKPCLLFPDAARLDLPVMLADHHRVGVGLAADESFAEPEQGADDQLAGVRAARIDGEEDATAIGVDEALDDHRHRRPASVPAMLGPVGGHAVGLADQRLQVVIQVQAGTGLAGQPLVPGSFRAPVVEDRL